MLYIFYCAEAAKTPLYAANLREEAKLLKYFQAYKQLDDIHFEPLSGGNITHSNALKWAMAHNESKNPDIVYQSISRTVTTTILKKQGG